MYKKNYQSKSKTPTTKYTPKSKEYVPKYIQAYIKKAVSTGVAKTEEVKCAILTSSYSLQGYNTGVLASSWYNQCVFPVCPYGGAMNISQGTSQGDRIGNKIRTKRCTLEYVISPKPYNVATNFNPQPMLVKIWIITPKDDPTSLPSQGSFVNFFQNAAGSMSPSGAMQDIISEVNMDLFQVHTYRNHKVGCSTVTGTGNNAQYEFFANNDFGLAIKGKIDVTRFIAKEFIFNDSAPFPNNKTAYVVMECVPTTGFTNGTQEPCNFVSQLKYEFTDA